MKDLSRAPLRHPNQTAAEIEEQLLALRRAHMRWGPRKLRQVLWRAGMPAPAASTIGALLKREGLVVDRRSGVESAAVHAAVRRRRRAQPGVVRRF